MSEQTRLRNRQIRSLLTEDGRLKLFVKESEVPEPGPGEVVIRVEASPLNPSDQLTMTGPADMSTARAGEESGLPALLFDVSPEEMERYESRIGKPLPAGNEGAGTVLRAGAGAEALLGKTVAVMTGKMYARYCVAPAKMCLVMPDGVSAREAASAFVNPLTALGMVETMRREGHKAIVHAAAVSNLGQMLNRICIADGIDLVNIVRREEQAELLKSQGAKYALNSSDPDFRARLTDAIAETEATIAFDPIGGGALADDILVAMERAITRLHGPPANIRYGSTIWKQVYIYGILDDRPTTLNRTAGLAWGVGGWLLTTFLARIGKDAEKLRARVAAEIRTTFASHYAGEISLEEMLDPAIFARYSAQQTGQKYLVTPAGGED